MDPIIAAIRGELAAHADPAIRESSKRFFREEITSYGIRTATVTAIAKKYWKEVRHREKGEIVSLCEELYRSGYLEEAGIVSEWARALQKRFGPDDLAIFERWIGTWITNWAACDGLCNHAIGDFLVRYPAQAETLTRWAASENRWMRRAAFVSLILPARRGEFLSLVLGLAGLALSDPDDMVQKGAGWLLKEAGRRHTDEVFAFVMQHRNTMPRTMLRYAIELMPRELKAEAMRRV